MIKNRNVALDAAIDPSKIAGGVGFRLIRDTFYVVGASSEAYTYLLGKVPSDRLYNTLTEALALANDFDRIIVYPGDYDEGVVLNITQEGLQILGPGNDMQNQAMILGSAADHILMTINAHNVLVDGLGFTQTNAKVAIETASTTASYKITISNCRIDGYGAGTYGIFCNATQDSPDLVLEHNTIRSCATSAIGLNASRVMCRNNRIWTPAGTAGVEAISNAGDRAYGVIEDNTIQGVNSTDTGILLTGTPSAGALSISRNYILGCATTITQTANNAYNSVNNYEASAAGGVLIDTVA